MTVTQKQIDASRAAIKKLTDKLAVLETKHRALMVEWKRDQQLARLQAEMDAVENAK